MTFESSSASVPFDGPILFSRGATGARSDLDALIVMADAVSPPPLALAPGGSSSGDPTCIYTGYGKRAWRYRFSLPPGSPSWYALGAARFEVMTDLHEDVRVVYVSCNGQEHGDREREPHERDRLWRRLADEYRENPFHLMLHGGDQIYADEMQNSHQTLRRWSGPWPRRRRRMPFSDEASSAAEQWLLETYIRALREPSVAFLQARIPSLMMWDDHDIIDGWGSLRRWRMASPIGQGLFTLAHKMFCVFQRGLAPDEAQASIPLTYAETFPGFAVVLPDLRGERQPDRVMSDTGWAEFKRCLRHVSNKRHVFMMSSVPVLGPRLALLERLLGLWPRMQKYEDDLRDQWQSHAHRDEWVRLLNTLATYARETPVTVLSGEIHVAARGELNSDDATLVHQLVSSGVSHPAPPWVYAKALGLLATFGAKPGPGLAIAMRGLPGDMPRYVAERNFLVLERTLGDWYATWRLEDSGDTHALLVSPP